MPTIVIESQSGDGHVHDVRLARFVLHVDGGVSMYAVDKATGRDVVVVLEASTTAELREVLNGSQTEW